MQHRVQSELLMLKWAQHYTPGLKHMGHINAKRIPPHKMTCAMQ